MGIELPDDHINRICDQDTYNKLSQAAQQLIGDNSGWLEFTLPLSEDHLFEIASEVFKHYGYAASEDHQTIGRGTYKEILKRGNPEQRDCKLPTTILGLIIINLAKSKKEAIELFLAVPVRGSHLYLVLEVEGIACKFDYRRDFRTNQVTPELKEVIAQGEQVAWEHYVKSEIFRPPGCFAYEFGSNERHNLGTLQKLDSRYIRDSLEEE